MSRRPAAARCRSSPSRAVSARRGGGLSSALAAALALVVAVGAVVVHAESRIRRAIDRGSWAGDHRRHDERGHGGGHVRRRADRHCRRRHGRLGGPLLGRIGVARRGGKPPRADDHRRRRRAAGRDRLRRGSSGLPTRAPRRMSEIDAEQPDRAPTTLALLFRPGGLAYADGFLWVIDAQRGQHRPDRRRVARGRRRPNRGRRRAQWRWRPAAGRCGSQTASTGA